MKMTIFQFKSAMTINLTQTLTLTVQTTVLLNSQQITAVCLVGL